MEELKNSNPYKEALKELLDGGVFVRSGRSIDISKVLDGDSKIDLWLLEVALIVSNKLLHRVSRVSGSEFKSVQISGIDEYKKARGISDEKLAKELRFVMEFQKAVQNEDLYLQDVD